MSMVVWYGSVDIGEEQKWNGVLSAKYRYMDQRREKLHFSKYRAMEHLKEKWEYLRLWDYGLKNKKGYGYQGPERRDF